MLASGYEVHGVKHAARNHRGGIALVLSALRRPLCIIGMPWLAVVFHLGTVLLHHGGEL